MEAAAAAAAAAAANERCTTGTRNRAQIPAFGNWDFDHQHQVPITQYFDCCARPHSVTATRAAAYPYAPCYPRSYSHSGYVDDEFLNSMFAAGDDFHGLYYAGMQQHQLDYFNKHHHHHARPPPSPNMTGGSEVKGELGTRRRRRRRSYLDNRTKVFDMRETSPAARECCYDAVVTPDLYDAGSIQKGEARKKKKKWNNNNNNNVKGKDEDLYKIPPELLRKTKRKKMSKFFNKCLVTICASY